jgi:hypothetical protein
MLGVHNTLQLTVKSVAIFAKQKYAPLSPAAELGRWTKTLSRWLE